MPLTELVVSVPDQLCVVLYLVSPHHDQTLFESEDGLIFGLDEDAVLKQISHVFFVITLVLVLVLDSNSLLSALDN